MSGYVPFNRCMPRKTILLDKKNAARSLSISEGTLENLVRRGAIKVVRIGDRVLFLRETLEEFARKSVAPPVASLPREVRRRDGMVSTITVAMLMLACATKSTAFAEHL